MTKTPSERLDPVPKMLDVVSHCTPKPKRVDHGSVLAYYVLDPDGFVMTPALWYPWLVCHVGENTSKERNKKVTSL